MSQYLWRTEVSRQVTTRQSFAHTFQTYFITNFLCMEDLFCLNAAASETSSPSSRPRKRRRQGNGELHELLAAQHKSNAQLLEQHANKLFEQQKALLDQEAAHMQQMVSTITSSFLQGTQMMMSALMNTHQAGLMGFAMPQGAYGTPQGAFATPQSTFVTPSPVQQQQQHNTL